MVTISKSDCNAIVVILLHFLTPIGAYIAVSHFMGAPKRAIGTLIYGFIPILNIINAIDNFLVASKLQKGESVDEFHHEIGFLSGLPLLHEQQLCVLHTVDAPWIEPNAFMKALKKLFNSRTASSIFGRGKLVPPRAKPDPNPAPLIVHDTVIKDEYRWLQDPQNPQVLEYLRQENEYMHDVMKDTLKFQRSIIKEIKQRFAAEPELGVPEYDDKGYYYYAREVPGGEYPIYCRIKKNPTNVHQQEALHSSELEHEEVVLDHNQLAQSHAYASVGTCKLSESQEIMALTIDTKGTEDYAVQIRHISSGKVIEELTHYPIVNVEFASDDRTVFYTIADHLKRPYKVLKHTIGSPQSMDVVIFEEPDHKFFVDVNKTKDKKYLTINCNSKTASEVRLMRNDPQNPVFQLSQNDQQQQQQMQQVLQMGLKLVRPRQEGIEYYIEHNRDTFFIITNADGAENYKVVTCPASEILGSDDGDDAKQQLQQQVWRDFIHPEEDTKIEDMDMFRDYMVLYQRNKGVPEIRIVDMRGQQFAAQSQQQQLQQQLQRDDDDVEDASPTQFFVPLPGAGVGTIQPGVNGAFETDMLRFSYSSPIMPEAIFDYDMSTRQLIKRKQMKVENYDPSDFVCERHFVPSKKNNNHNSTHPNDPAARLANNSIGSDDDTVLVPLTVVHRKDLELNSSNPVLLHGYGAYGQNVEPDFDIESISLLERGFVYAIAHVRGGAELGRKWYDQGKLLQKKNTFHDFIACAEYLIARKYTRQGLLCASGVSAGGLLMGAVITMRPDLFRCALLKVPFLDVTTTMLDDTLPLVLHEYDEWGNIKDDPRVFHYIRSYSPYDNVANIITRRLNKEEEEDAQLKPPAEAAAAVAARSQKQSLSALVPSIYVTCALGDPRVPYWNAAKFVARLRNTILQQQQQQQQKSQATAEPDAAAHEGPLILLKSSLDHHGHFEEGGRFAKLQSTAFEFAFMFKALGLLAGAQQPKRTAASIAAAATQSQHQQQHSTQCSQ